MSSEEKELDEIMGNAKLDLVPVPDELEDRINKWVITNKKSKKKTRFRSYLIGAAAASFLFAGFIASPTAMTYAKDIPVIGKAFNWFEQYLAEYKGIKTAEENEYKPFKPHSFMAGDYTLEIDHLLLEDEQIFFTLMIKGGDIPERVFKDQSGMLVMKEYLNVHIESKDFARHPDTVEGAAASMGVHDVSGEYVLLAKYTLFIDPHTVKEFINNEGKLLSFEVDIEGHKANVEIPLENSKIQLGRYYNQSQQLITQEQPFTIKQLAVYPTRMVLELSGGSEEGFLQMISGEEKPYLKDEHGKVYSLRMLQVNPDAYKLESLSSIYFNKEVSQLTLFAGSKEEGVPLNITE